VNSVLNLRVPQNAGKLSSVQTSRDPSSSAQLHEVSNETNNVSKNSVISPKNEKKKKSSYSECYTPLSEPFRIYQQNCIENVTTKPGSTENKCCYVLIASVF
jgi:hypothetical protein